MKVLLDIKDEKASSLLEVLQSLSYVKMKPLSSYKAKVFEDIKAAVDEMNLIEEGKLQGSDAKELFDDL